MNKKNIFLISILLLSFYFMPTITKADDNDIIHDIESVTIKDGKIIFSGWAFIHNINNVGGKNLKISIVAVRNGSGNLTNLNSITSDNDKLKVTEENYDSPHKNLFQAMCFRNTSGNCIQSESNATCDPSSTTSSCIYNNVGFTISFSLEDLKLKFGTDNIVFALLVDYYDECDKEGEKCGGEYHEKSIPLTVDKNSCYYGNSNSVCSDEFNAGDYGIMMSGLASEVNFIANDARVLNSNANRIENNLYWKNGGVYAISGLGSVTRYNTRIYELKYNGVRDSTAVSTNYGASFTNTGYALASWIRVEGSLMLTINQKITLTTPGGETDTTEIKECSKITYNEDLKCSTTTSYEHKCNNTVSITYTVEDKYPTVCNGNEYKNLSHTVYINTSIKHFINVQFNQQSTEVIAGQGFTFDASYKNTISWDFTKDSELSNCPTNVIYTSYEKTNNKCDDGYEYINGEDNNETYYIHLENNENWNDYEIGNEVRVTNFYVYGNRSKVWQEFKKKNDGYVEVGETDALKQIDDGEKYKEINSMCYNFNDYLAKKPNTTTTSCVREYYNNYGCSYETNKNAVINKMSTYIEDNTISEQLIKLKSYDSNTYPSDYSELEGEWTCNGDFNNNWINDTDITIECKYNLKNAYLNLKTAQISYGNYVGNSEYENQGIKKFTPINYMYDNYVGNETINGKKYSIYGGNFPINLSITNISLFKKTIYNISYSCETPVRQKLYDNNGTYSFYYRPIDLNNPFPERIPQLFNNWVDFYEENISGNGGAFPSITVDDLEYTAKLNSNAIQIIREYNNGVGNAGYLNNSINVDGKSGFISKFNNDFLERKNAIYYQLGSDMP